MPCYSSLYPYLWDDLEKHFSNKVIPYPEDDFRKEIFGMFEKFTGNKIDSKENIDVSEYSRGGMSSGMISQEFWLESALPLLVERLRRLNPEN